jgi:ABC-type branched-subunit amino acid transport system substrate-binding protein
MNVSPLQNVSSSEVMAMSSNDGLQQYAQASLVSVVLTAIAITVNHAYTLGVGAFLLGATLVVVPAVLLMWFRRTGSKAAFIGYLLMNLWLVVGFGLVEGLWDSTLRVFLGTLLASLSTSFPKPVIGSFGFEMSGIVTFIGSLFVLYYALKLVPWQPTVGQKALLATSASLAVAAIVGAYVATDRDTWVAPPNGVVKIGVIVPTGGPYALLGNSFVKAVQMAKDDLKDTKYQYQLVIRDSGPDPVNAAAVIRRVISEDKVDAIVGGISLIGQVTKPFATKARIPHMCVCTVAWIGDGAYNFTNIPSPEAEGALWAREAKKRGIETIALITQDYPSINNHVKALKIEAARVGLSITNEQTFKDSVIDFRSIIAQANASRPDIYYVEALNPGLDLLAQQLTDAKIHNVASVVAPSLSEKTELFEGMWYTDSNLREVAFKQRFEDKYPGTRFATHMMPYAYDSVNMIVQAFERGQNPAIYLRNIRTYDGTAGALTKQPGSGNFASTPAVWVITNGKPTLTARR